MLEIVDVISSEEIVDNIFDIIDKYHTDMYLFSTFSIYEIYNFVRKIPYRLEDGEYQLLARPKKILSGEVPFIACANKSILLGSYLRLKDIPFVLTIVGYSEDGGYSHIFPEIKSGEFLLPLDATLNKYRLSLGPEKFRYLKRIVPSWQENSNL